MPISQEELLTAEAHLYVGIAKADGIVSKNEYTQVPYYADRSKKFFEKKEKIAPVQPKLGKKIREIFNSPHYKEYDSSQHLTAASKTLQQAHNEGSWNAKLILFRNERGFLDAAKIDGYVIKEASFIRKMEETLGAIFEYQEE